MLLYIVKIKEPLNYSTRMLQIVALKMLHILLMKMIQERGYQHGSGKKFD